MIHGVAIPSVALPCSRRTDMFLERNQTYDLSSPPIREPLLPNVPLGDGHETHEEYERRDQSPVPHMSSHYDSLGHTAPSSTHHSAGAAPGFYVTEEMWREHLALEEMRDGMLTTLQQKLTDNMSFMQTSQQHTDQCLHNIMQSQLAISTEQQRQHGFFRGTLHSWRPLRVPYQ